MAGAEIANVRSVWSYGNLQFQDVRTGDIILQIGSSTSIPFGAPQRKLKNVTAAATLAASTDMGLLVYCTTDGVVIGLSDHASSTSYGARYTIMNCASDGGALLVVKAAGTGSSAWFAAGGTVSATTNTVIANTKATQQYGDFITVAFNASTCWQVIEQAGTWALSATS